MLTTFTPIAIQFAPEAEVVMTTWGDFRANNADAFTVDELDEIATDLNGSLGAVFAGMAMIWIAE